MLILVQICTVFPTFTVMFQNTNRNNTKLSFCDFVPGTLRLNALSLTKLSIISQSWSPNCSSLPLLIYGYIQLNFSEEKSV